MDVRSQLSIQVQRAKHSGGNWGRYPPNSQTLGMAEVEEPRAPCQNTTSLPHHPGRVTATGNNTPSCIHRGTRAVRILGPLLTETHILGVLGRIICTRRRIQIALRRTGRQQGAPHVDCSMQRFHVRRTHPFLTHLIRQFGGGVSLHLLQNLGEPKA